MLNIAVCDDSRTDVEMLESAFDKLAQYQFSYEVYFTAKELLKHVIDDGEMYHLYIFDIEMPEMNGLQWPLRCRGSCRGKIQHPYLPCRRFREVCGPRAACVRSISCPRAFGP